MDRELFAFYQLPKALFTDEHFRGTSPEAKIIYSLLLDRMSLSVKNVRTEANGAKLAATRVLGRFP